MSMKPNPICTLLLAVALAFPSCAEPSVESSASQGCTTLKDAVILIIRHAEKPESGYELSPAGQKRAEAYVGYFKNFTLDSQPFKFDYLFATADSKSSHRPRLTLEPLSQALALKLDVRFKNKQFQDLTHELQSQDHGKHILIAWHHGEIAELAESLGASPAALLPKGKWPPEEYGWVLQLRYDHAGRLIAEQTKCIHEKLMPGDD
ncbi:MAG: hypothetical protein JWQ04_2547 [Pedosphaera sp.]|nr:hypothetical protein [Pedosphaera sp.]